MRKHGVVAEDALKTRNPETGRMDHERWDEFCWMRGDDKLPPREEVPEPDGDDAEPNAEMDVVFADGHGLVDMNLLDDDVALW